MFRSSEWGQLANVIIHWSHINTCLISLKASWNNNGSQLILLQIGHSMSPTSFWSFLNITVLAPLLIVMYHKWCAAVGLLCMIWSLLVCLALHVILLSKCMLRCMLLYICTVVVHAFFIHQYLVCQHRIELWNLPSEVSFESSGLE